MFNTYSLPFVFLDFEAISESMEEPAMEQSNQQSVKETTNVREAGYIIKSENLDEIRPWYMETRSGQTDDDGSDKHYDQE
jgi:hypothetical protein